MGYNTFGGEIDIRKQKGLDKFITKLVNKKLNMSKEIKLLSENMEKFISLLRQKME